MSLYNKNLRSLEDLKREKLLLKAQADNAINNLLSTNKTGEINLSDPDKKFGVGDAVKAGIDIFTSKGMINTAVAVAMPILSLAKIKVEKKVITSVAKEVLGSYLKWKAVQLGYSIVTGIVVNKFSKPPTT